MTATMIRTATYRPHALEPKPTTETNNATPEEYYRRERIGEYKPLIINGTMGSSLAAVEYVLRFNGCPGRQVPSIEPTSQGLGQELSGGRYV